MGLNSQNADVENFTVNKSGAVTPEDPYLINKNHSSALPVNLGA